MNKKILILLSLIFCIIFSMQESDNNMERRFDGFCNDVKYFTHSSFQSETPDSAISIPEAQCQVPRPGNFINSSRNHTQTKRNGQTSFNHGFTLTKSGKSMNSYSTSQFSFSIIRFPSGLVRNSTRFISLEKLVI
ncbi:MAG: hypothetical protein IJZ70_03290 [Bacteroidales bacterium]|nr:hypothetical protein [Bacteroidales bacterium]